MIQALLVSALLLASAQDPGEPPAGSETAQDPEPPAEEVADDGPAATDDGTPLPELPALPEELGPPPPPTRPSSQMLSAVQLIVNERCITSADVLIEAMRIGATASTREDYQRILQQIAGELTRRLLAEQAGRDLGYEPEMVGALVRNKLEERKESAGSISELARQLDQFDLDSAELRESTENQIYRELHEGSVVGKFAGPEGRHFRDRFVRPGELRLEFLRQGSKLELPATVSLQEMLILPGRGEPIESVRQRAHLVHSRLLKGEDFVELNAQFGIPGRSPDLNPIEESKIALMPEIHEFTAPAGPGDISEVLPAARDGQLMGFRILRFVSRDAGAALSFVDREFQARLTQEILANRDAYRIDQALRGLLDAAYVWPPEAIGRGPSPEAAAASGSPSESPPESTPVPEPEPEPEPDSNR